MIAFLEFRQPWWLWQSFVNRDAYTDILNDFHQRRIQSESPTKGRKYQILKKISSYVYKHLPYHGFTYSCERYARTFSFWSPKLTLWLPRIRVHEEARWLAIFYDWVHRLFINLKSEDLTYLLFKTHEVWSKDSRVCVGSLWT